MGRWSKKFGIKRLVKEQIYTSKRQRSWPLELQRKHTERSLLFFSRPFVISSRTNPGLLLRRYVESCEYPGIEWVAFLHPKRIIFLNCGWDLSSRKLAHALIVYLELKEVNSFYMIRKILEPVSGTSRRGARAAYHDEYPRDFGPRIAYTVSWVSDTRRPPTLCRPPIRQGGREMSAPRPYETYPLLPQSSVHILYWNQFLYIFKKVQVISSIWYVQACLGTLCIWHLHMRSFITVYLRVQSYLKSWFVVLITCHLRIPICWKKKRNRRLSRELSWAFFVLLFGKKKV